VPIAELHFVSEAVRSSSVATPEETGINVEGIHERLVIAQHDSIQHVSQKIADLKQFLKIEGAPASTARDLDKLCGEVEESWDAAIRSIVESLEQ
jgi:hypothetical protein